MKMKRIIFLLAHLQYSDGVAKVLCDICNALPKDEYDITVKSLYRYEKNFIKNFDSDIKATTFLGGYFRGLDKLLELLPTKLLYKMIVKDKYDVEIGFQYGLPTRVIAASTNNNATHIAWMHGYDEGLVLIDSYKKSNINNPTIGIIISKKQDKFVAEYVKSEKLIPLTYEFA